MPRRPGQRRQGRFGQADLSDTLSDQTAAALRMPIKSALRTTQAETALKDKVWGQNYGVTSVSLSAGAESRRAELYRPSHADLRHQRDAPARLRRAGRQIRVGRRMHGRRSTALNLSSDSDVTVGADGSFSGNADEQRASPPQHMRRFHLDDMGNVIADRSRVSSFCRRGLP